MEIQVLGCAGGIGGQVAQGGPYTTALLAGDDTLIDCGSGVGVLTHEALLRIDRIFLTHSHFDHIAMLPLLLDSVADSRTQPVCVYALPETLLALQRHVFNWVMWPDFLRIPSPNAPVLELRPVAVGQSIDLPGGRLSVLPASHSVPAVGYALHGGAGSLAYTGDTTVCAALSDALNTLTDLRYLLVESAFPEHRRDLAQRSQHMSPSLLDQLLQSLAVRPEVYVGHLKPAYAVQTLEEIAALSCGALSMQVLAPGQRFVI